MKHKSKEALDHLLEVIKNADKTFLDPEKVIDEQGKVDGYQHLPLHIIKSWAIMLTQYTILLRCVATRNIS